MKAFTVLRLIVSMLGGCTTLQPVANVPGDLTQHFSDGDSKTRGQRDQNRDIGGRDLGGRGGACGRD